MTSFSFPAGKCSRKWVSTQRSRGWMRAPPPTAGLVGVPAPGMGCHLDSGAAPPSVRGGRALPGSC